MKNPRLFQSVLTVLFLLASVSSYSKEYLIENNIKSNDLIETSLPFTSGIKSSVVGPTIGTSPVNQSVCVGSTISLSVVATGNGNLNYVWKKDGNILFDNTGFVVGSRTANLSVINAQSTDAGTYACEVTDGQGARFLSPTLSPDFDTNLCQKVDASQCADKEKFTNYSKMSPVPTLLAGVGLIFLLMK
jgi:hypothetical protein